MARVSSELHRYQGEAFAHLQVWGTDMNSEPHSSPWQESPLIWQGQLEVPSCFPRGTGGKEPACQCRRHKRCGFDPWVRKISLEEGMATHSSFLPRESHGQRSLVVTIHEQCPLFQPLESVFHLFPSLTFSLFLRLRQFCAPAVMWFLAYF